VLFDRRTYTKIIFGGIQSTCEKIPIRITSALNIRRHSNGFTFGYRLLIKQARFKAYNYH